MVHSLKAGVLLNERWVLTTTTCVAGYMKPKKSVRDYSVGFGHQNDLEKIYHYRVRAKSILMHPEFGVVDGLIVNDVALLELDTAVTFNYTKESSIGPACLATTNYNRFVETKNLNVIENLVVAGYGYTKTVSSAFCSSRVRPVSANSSRSGAHLQGRSGAG